MKIVEAEVISNKDAFQAGGLTVYSKAVGEYQFNVIYTSPYSAPYDGGFFSVPEEGSYILIVKPEGSNTWYFMSCIHSSLGQIPKEAERKDLKNKSLIPESVYKTRGYKPQQLLFQDPQGNFLKLSHSKSPEEFNIKAELSSSLGKRLILSDSPKMDTVILRNEHGDKLKISSSPNGMSAGRSIEADAKGPVSITSRESDIDVRVVDGREITIENTSTGFNDANWYPNEEKRYGNVNLKSKWTDINITTDSQSGKVFIRSKGSDSLVQINTDGSMVIRAGKDVSIQSEGSIHLKAEEELNLQGTSVNIKGETVKVSGQTSNLNMDDNVAIQGVRVDLNPVNPLLPAESATPESPVTNRYGD